MKLSIIIPVYNSEKKLNETIESIITQKGEYELILVDDGSEDRSLSICNYYAQWDKRIKVIHIENSGVANARNIGLESSQGEYIQFVDSDDKLQEGAINKIFYEIKSDADIIVFSYSTFGKVYGENIVPKMNNVSLRQKVEFLLEKGLIVPCWNKVYKRSTICDVRFNTDLSYAEDYCFNLEVFNNVNSLSMISDLLYQYRIENESLSSGYNEINFIVAKYIRKRSIDLLEQYGSKEISMIERNYAYNISSIIKRMICKDEYCFSEKVGVMKKYCDKDYIEAMNRFYPGIYSKLLRIKAFVLVVVYLQLIK